MVDINNLYNSINNPLTDEVAEKLLNMYLSGQDINNYLKFQYYNEDETLTEEEEKMWMNWVLTTRDEFYSVLFNSWKDKITSKSIDEITSFINKYPQKIDNDYYQLVESMRTVPDVKSFQEINGITHNNDLIRHYWYNVLGESFWDYVKSWPLMEDENRMNTEHRLYLNTEGTDCYFMCTAFLKKCLATKTSFIHLKITMLLASTISKRSPKLSSNIFSPTPPELLIISLNSHLHIASKVVKFTLLGVQPSSHIEILGKYVFILSCGVASFPFGESYMKQTS